MYSALDIAKYIISKCTQENCPVSNLQLQKILYYIQKEFLENGSIAFKDEIEAWQFGPVIPSVYHRYCGFGALPIRMQYVTNICSDDQRIINYIVDKKRRLNLWYMVDDIQCPNKAWYKIYNHGLGNHQVIPKELICDKTFNILLE